MGSEKVYPEGLLGRKVGMTQVFTAGGERVPVTIIQTGPCFVLDVKSKDRHGYSAVQLGFGPKKPQRATKAARGHFARTGAGAFYHVKEIRCDVDNLAASNGAWNTPGKELTVADVFEQGQHVDVSGVTKGRGFSGVVRKWSVGGFPATRGTHEYRRHIGAIGCRKFPGHVFKNKHMPGHYGNDKMTVQNLEVVGVRPEDNLLLVRGGVPGPKGSLVVIRKAVKSYEPGSKKAAS